MVTQYLKFMRLVDICLNFLFLIFKTLEKFCSVLNSQTYTTLDIPYNGMTVKIEEDLEKLKADQTIRWSTEGGDPTEYRYIFTAKDRHLWTNTLGSSIDKADEVMALNPGLYYISKTTAAEAKVSVESGKEYILIVTAVDEEGKSSESTWWEFTY